MIATRNESLPNLDGSFTEGFLNTIQSPPHSGWREAARFEGVNALLGALPEKLSYINRVQPGDHARLVVLDVSDTTIHCQGIFETMFKDFVRDFSLGRYFSELSRSELNSPAYDKFLGELQKLGMDPRVHVFTVGIANYGREVAGITVSRESVHRYLLEHAAAPP